MVTVETNPVLTRAMPGSWCYFSDQDMYLLGMKAVCDDGYVIEVDCIVSLTKESRRIGKWYWHTRTVFCDHEGYERELDEAMGKSMDLAFELFRIFGARRIPD